MKLKLTWLLTLFMAFVMQFSFAQEKTVTGTVTTAADGLPLPGASVIVKGTSSGQQTDFDGKYTIQVNEGDVLIFSYVGMVTSELEVGSSSVVNVALKEDSLLDEVVVVAYGKTVASAKSTSATVQLTSEGFENRPNVNLINSLQGQAAGVNISSFSGQPGTNKNDVVIRGNASLSGSSDPLYVIDGVPLTQAFFRNLNQNEIESVTVLKDASATAVYGNRGTNGVILITTKQGSFNESFGVSYSSSYGYTNFIEDDYNLGSAIDQLKLQRKGFDEGVGVLASSFAVTGSYLGGALTLDPNNLDAYEVNTDWTDIFFRQGVTQSHDVSLTSGGEKTKNFTNFGYFEQDGIVPNTGFQRFTIRNNFSGKSLDEKFNYSLNVFSAFSKRDQLEQETRGGINNNVLQNPLTGYISSSRFMPVDLYQSGQQLFDEFGGASLNLIPYMLLDLQQGQNSVNEYQEFKTILTLNASYKITDNLTFGITTGGDYAQDNRVYGNGPESYLSVIRASGANQPYHGIEDIANTREFMFNHVNRLSYDNTFGNNHSIEVSLFTEYLKAHRTTNFQRQIGLNPLTWSPGAGTGYIPFDPETLPASYLPAVSASERNAGMFSYFGTLDYGYKEKYGFSASVRRDATYRFIDDNKWGTFWSVAGRWNITEEDFIGESDILNDLKLRASYGTTGNQNVVGRGVDSATSDIFLGPQLVRDLNASSSGYLNSASFAVSSFANTDLIWETTTQFNVGIDFGMFNRRFAGSIDYYSRLTEDLFQSLPISASNGTSAISANDGELLNKGFEFQGRYNIFRDGKFKLSVFGNIGYNIDTFETLGSVDTDGDGEHRVGESIIRYEGGQLSEYYLVPYAGVNPANGNLLFVDINGDLTEAPTDEDRRKTGKSLFPKYSGGFGFDAEYDGFFLNTLFTYSADAYRFDNNLWSAYDIRQAGDSPVSNDLFNAWTPSNRNTDIPALAASNIDSQDLSDRFLRDASFLRLRNVTIGYNVPNRFLSDIFLEGLTVRVIAENYFTFTNWKGLDAERSVGGESIGFYPTPKILTFGIDANF
ncbi:SusC/RagA family TonB-linked outer membrane protein [Winogradskyella vidalii]|uniref:SusC/RagA family TonB-linked outer membrane protein n=1 Tax=Winogradskyella vidalii TaxID=2615024 RepID=UPI0015CDB0FF|nr:SusC/RagA family TonB-linked outer membrane protein [Winogradskyella vidalii]